MRDKIKRGQVWYAKLGRGFGHEQGSSRPVLIIQNGTGNKHSPTVIVACITAKRNKTQLPTHVFVPAADISGNKFDSLVLLEQIRTIDKRRLTYNIGYLTHEQMKYVDQALKVSLGL